MSSKTQTALVSMAAALRAAGETWEAIGVKVGRSAETVRQWPSRHPDDWARHYRRAETHLVADAACEARQALRLFIRSKTEKTALAAAMHVFNARQRERDRELDREAAAPPAQDQEAVHFVQQLKSIDDEELDEMLKHELDARRPAGPCEAGEPTAENANHG